VVLHHVVHSYGGVPATRGVASSAPRGTRYALRRCKRTRLLPLLRAQIRYIPLGRTACRLIAVTVPGRCKVLGHRLTHIVQWADASFVYPTLLSTFAAADELENTTGLLSCRPHAVPAIAFQMEHLACGALRYVTVPVVVASRLYFIILHARRLFLPRYTERTLGGHARLLLLTTKKTHSALAVDAAGRDCTRATRIPRLRLHRATGADTLSLAGDLLGRAWRRVGVGISPLGAASPACLRDERSSNICRTWPRPLARSPRKNACRRLYKLHAHHCSRAPPYVVPLITLPPPRLHAFRPRLLGHSAASNTDDIYPHVSYHIIPGQMECYSNSSCLSMLRYLESLARHMNTNASPRLICRTGPRVICGQKAGAYAHATRHHGCAVRRRRVSFTSRWAGRIERGRRDGPHAISRAVVTAVYCLRATSLPFR